MKPIVILDYGLANLRSVQKGFEKMGTPALITNDPNQVHDADKVVLPGVGAFRDGIAGLHATGLAEPIKEHVRKGKPLLGICLGMQLLFTRSHEDGVHQGLDIFPGKVVRFDQAPGLKVPHMGWNTLRIRKAAPIFRDLPPDPSVYFVHSYCVKPANAEIIAAETDYPSAFTSVIWSGNVMATQFHPEKSQAIGLNMLKNFAQS